MTIIMIYHVRSKYTAVGKFLKVMAVDSLRHAHVAKLCRPEGDPPIFLHLFRYIAIGHLLGQRYYSDCKHCLSGKQLPSPCIT
jgi:hypothetical protein